MSTTVSAGTGALTTGRIAEVSVEIDIDLIALQKVTLNRVGHLTGHFEKTPLLVAMGSSLAERGVGS
jgi:hypothetical protein